MFTAVKDDNISNLKHTAQNFRAAANETVEEAKGDLREAAGKAGRKVRHFLQSTGDELTHAKDAVTSQIRTNPVQSSLVALGIGVVLGALLRR